MRVHIGVNACDVRKDYFFEFFLENVRVGKIFRARICTGMVTVVEGKGNIQT